MEMGDNHKKNEVTKIIFMSHKKEKNHFMSRPIRRQKTIFFKYYLFSQITLLTGTIEVHLQAPQNTEALPTVDLMLTMKPKHLKL